jgi:hypothetical protein
MFRFSLDRLRGRTLAGLPPPALEGFFIGSADRSGRGIVAGQGGAGHGIDRCSAEAPGRAPLPA